jgi:hypothetical protein
VQGNFQFGAPVQRRHLVAAFESRHHVMSRLRPSSGGSPEQD